MSEKAPFHAELAEGPSGGHAVWVFASDGVRLRVGVWPKGTRGTVLIFPGRTEYIEKYGRAAAYLAARGYASVAIDWRGQGLADRLLPDPKIGHVVAFTDYQKDVAALLAYVAAHSLPRPLYLMAHSMGGGIGLRALMEGLPVNAAVFSAPMWGFLLPARSRPFVRAVAKAACLLGLSHRYALSAQRSSYLATTPFEGNVLSSDPDGFAHMQNQVRQRPELALAGPSMGWLHEALVECAELAARPSPNVPTLTMLGTKERVVDTAPVHDRMARWPNGRLELVEGAEHELIMDCDANRQSFFDKATALYAAHP